MSSPSFIIRDKTLDQILDQKQSLIYKSLYNYLELPYTTCPEYKSYLFSIQGRERIKRYVGVATSSIKVSPKTFYDDQKVTSRARACQGFALQGVLNVSSLLEKSIWDNVIAQCELLNKKSLLAVLNKSLLLSQHLGQSRNIISLSYNDVITSNLDAYAKINKISPAPYFNPLIEAIAGELLVDSIESAHYTLHILTSNEKRVLGLVCEGHKNKEIAKELYLSVDTVKYYIKSILQKLNAADRTQAVTIAFRMGLLK